MATPTSRGGAHQYHDPDRDSAYDPRDQSRDVTVNGQARPPPSRDAAMTSRTVLVAPTLSQLPPPPPKPVASRADDRRQDGSTDKVDVGQVHRRLEDLEVGCSKWQDVMHTQDALAEAVEAIGEGLEDLRLSTDEDRRLFDQVRVSYLYGHLLLTWVCS